MAYTKTTWTDEVLAGAERFDIKDDGGTPIYEDVQIVLATTVTTPGTAVDATNLNHIEQGIEDAHSTEKELRSTDDGTLPTADTGVEMYYDGSNSYIASIDRDTDTLKTLRILANPTAIIVPTSAPADSTLYGSTGFGMIAFYLDEAGSNVKIKLKLHDGTVKTVTLPMD